MKNILSWVLTSSVNPEKISTSIKGAMAFLLFFGIETGVDHATADNIGVAVGQIVSSIGQIVSAGIFVFGVVRKIVVTVRGKFTK